MSSSNYSVAASFALTDSAETFDYDELVGLLVSFAKARMAGGDGWTSQDVLRKLEDLQRSLVSLSGVLAAMDPQLQFIRKTESGHRHLVNARGVIDGHIASVADRIEQFTAAPTVFRFLEIQSFLAEIVASDVEKLARRHTRVILQKSGRGLSSNRTATASASTSPSWGSDRSNGSSLYGSYGGSRAKKLTRRHRRQ